MQVAIATLASDRAPLLVGEPGTAKSRLSEHLSAAISGTSQLLVQGTSGTTEDQIKHSWRYAMPVAKGPIPEALVPSPLGGAPRPARWLHPRFARSKVHTGWHAVRRRSPAEGPVEGFSLHRRIAGLLVMSIALTSAVPLLAGPASATNHDGWSAPMELDSAASWLNGGPLRPQVAVSADGHAAAAWTQYDDSVSLEYVEYAVFDPATGWGPTQALTNIFGNVNGPSVVALPNGSFYMAYATEGFLWPAIGGAMWVPGSGWSHFATVSVGLTPTANEAPVLAAGSAGNLFAVWLSDDGTDVNLTANRFTPADGWGTPVTIESLPATPFAHQVAADDSGNAIAVWLQSDGSVQRAYANRFVVGSGWGGSGTLIDNGATTASRVGVAATGGGDAVAVFAQHDGTAYRVYSNGFTAGAGWGGAEALSLPAGPYHATDSDVAASASGVVAAAWLADTPTYQDVHVATYTAAEGWSTVHNLTQDLDASLPPRIGVSGSGTVHVLFSAWPGGGATNFLPRAASWTSDGGWTASAALTTHSGTLGPVTCSTGEACAAFVHLSRGGYSAPSAALYTPPDATAPALTVTAPAEGASTGESTVVVSGTTEVGATVVVGGAVAHVAASGDFSVRVALEPGANTIHISATDAAGNSAGTTRTVTYNDPTAALEEELEQVHGQVDAVAGDLVTARAELNTTIAAARTAQDASHAAQQTEISAAGASAGTAMLVGLLGLLLAAAALGLGFMMGRRGSGGGSGSMPSSSPPARSEPAGAAPGGDTPKAS